MVAIQAWSLSVSFSQDLFFREAGTFYEISPDLLEAISVVESDRTINAVNKNKNGSTDFCHMQINDFTWKKHLGENWESLKDPRYCTMVGAWILKKCIDRYGYGWNAVACYHTGHSPSGATTLTKRERGERYIEKVKKALSRN